MVRIIVHFVRCANEIGNIYLYSQSPLLAHSVFANSPACNVETNIHSTRSLTDTHMRRENLSLPRGMLSADVSSSVLSQLPCHKQVCFLRPFSATLFISLCFVLVIFKWTPRQSAEVLPIAPKPRRPCCVSWEEVHVRCAWLTRVIHMRAMSSALMHLLWTLGKVFPSTSAHETRLHINWLMKMLRPEAGGNLPVFPLETGIQYSLTPCSCDFTELLWIARSNYIDMDVIKFKFLPVRVTYQNIKCEIIWCFKTP